MNLMMKKTFALLLCALWGLTFRPAEAASSFLQDDANDAPENICWHAAESREANQQNIAQCLQGASLEDLEQMQKEYYFPLWKMGCYIFEHSDLKALYDARVKAFYEDHIAPLFQDPSLENLAAVLDGSRFSKILFRDYIIGDERLNDTYIARALEALSFSDLIDMHNYSILG